MIATFSTTREKLVGDLEACVECKCTPVGFDFGHQGDCIEIALICEDVADLHDLSTNVRQPVRVIWPADEDQTIEDAES